MFNGAKARISMGKMDGLLRQTLRVACEVLSTIAQNLQVVYQALEGEENPSDGSTKSLRPLSLWTHLVEAVGLVPEPTDQGSNWIRNST